jgi:hypothetical protein
MLAGWNGRRSAALLVLALAVGPGAGAPAAADTYSCNDANGRPLMANSPPDGCAGVICQVKPNGARSCLSPPETDEQREAREIREEKDRKCQKKMLDKVLEGYRFLEKYSKRESIEHERDQAIAAQQQAIRKSRQRLELLESRQARLQAEAEFYGPAHPMPDELRANREANGKLLEEQAALVSRYEEEMRQIIERYDGMADRRARLLRHEVEPANCDK